MKNLDLQKRCRINTNFDEDTFVGLRCDAGDIQINFPIGFSLSNDDAGLRSDILLLFSTLSAHTLRKDSQLIGISKEYDCVEFPIQAFMYVIRDYLQRGYYHEQEVQYSVAQKGKINWNRTIKTQKPYVDNNNAYYLKFITKKNVMRENEIITLIHEYCVYESFSKVGWLFTKAMPQKPRINKNEKLFRSVLKEKIMNTFNDRNKALFFNMLSIINFMGDSNANQNYKFGTYRFEYVWESMIDKVFGVNNKEMYFPKTSWNIKGNIYDNASLEPDTIMVHNGNVYILDAKYYKYGIYPNPAFLPESTSISKQITYGEYVSTEKKFRELHGQNMNVYNAFLMPFNRTIWNGGVNDDIIKIGEGLSNWKDNNKDYQHIQGVLLDVKHLMKIIVSQNEEEITNLSKIIEGEVKKWEKAF
ncbi:MAG: LlaJI family restriction endonuclease [Lachnospiraceae bacterium]